MSTEPSAKRVLLLGGGPGLATSGVVHLAAYLRRNGVEAWARPMDRSRTLEELERSTRWLVERTQPTVVGISLKWFLHIHRTLYLAAVVKALDPGIVVVLGGDTASMYYEELLGFPMVDAVARGDGEAPLLACARGLAHPNLWTKERAPALLLNVPGVVAQTRDDDTTGLSHLDEVFLSESDRFSSSPFVVGAKGCSQGCLYCGGMRTAQATNFARRRSFLRPLEAVRRDIEQLAEITPCLVYDFSDHAIRDPTAHLAELWSDLDLRDSAVLYYAWHVPPLELVRLLAETHERATLGLDFGCFSQRQRAELGRAGLLKPLPDDAAFLDVIEECSRFPNVRVRVSGVAGLPLHRPDDLDAERRLVERLLELEIVEDVLFDLVHAQPGAPLTEAPERFGMASPVKTFQDFLLWSAVEAPLGEYRPALLAHVVDPAGTIDALGVNRRIRSAHAELSALVRTALSARARDGRKYAGWERVKDARFRRRRVRELARFRPSKFFLPFECPYDPSVADAESVLLATGHVWAPELGTSAVLAGVQDSFLPLFDAPTSVGDAVAALRAKGASAEEADVAELVAGLFVDGVLDEA